MRGWDQFGKLHLALPSQVEHPYQLVAALKSETVDRIVSDRRCQNSTEAHVGGASQQMASGHAFAEFECRPGEKVLVNADDLVDMFPSFDGTAERAVTNGVAVRACGAVFRGTAALRNARVANQQPVVPCLAGLVMGDINAADYATGSHIGVLS